MKTKLELSSGLVINNNEVLTDVKSFIFGMERTIEETLANGDTAKLRFDVTEFPVYARRFIFREVSDAGYNPIFREQTSNNGEDDVLEVFIEVIIT